MPPKAKKPSGGQKPEDEQDDPLQAVVFTDSYETRFTPFTLETPRVCIMHLCRPWQLTEASVSCR
jgi:translation initiation factor eIF-2B subunit epsilon